MFFVSTEGKFILSKMWLHGKIHTQKFLVVL
nr:MAG TPA: hypothetical protein [Caudoviricetes sp.]